MLRRQRLACYMLCIHEELLARFGGAPGVRDIGQLEAALARPQHLNHYTPAADLARLAACYACGIVRSHPMVDGNKRTAFLAAAVFIQKNGAALEAPEPEVVLAMTALAAGDWAEEAFAAWLRAHIRAGRLTSTKFNRIQQLINK